MKLMTKQLFTSYLLVYILERVVILEIILNIMHIM